MHKSTPEMQEAAKFVAYEWRQLSWAATEIRRIPEFGLGTGGTSPLEDALVEVLLLHARALRDFFGRSRRGGELKKYQETDIVAEDFYDETDGWPKSSFAYLGAKREIDRLNRALSHISYDRSAYEETGMEWDFDAITSELTDARESFLASLPSDRREWFL